MLLAMNPSAINTMMITERYAANILENSVLSIFPPAAPPSRSIPPLNLGKSVLIIRSE